MNWLLTAFAENATTGTGAELGTEGSIIAMLVQFGPLVLLFVAMYFIMIRPQKKKEKKAREMIDQAIVGDKIISIGGITGKIVNIKDDEFTIETGNERTKMTVKKWAIKEVDKPITE